MKPRRMYLPVHEIQDRRHKSDRIVQAIAPFLHYGRLYMFRGPKGAKFVQQLSDYSPTAEMHDDVLDMVSMAIMELFPYLQVLIDDDERTINQEMRVIQEEE